MCKVHDGRPKGNDHQAFTACLMKKQHVKGADEAIPFRSFFDPGNEELILLKYVSSKRGKDFLYQMSGRPFKS